MPQFGAHESISGGLHLAFERIHSVGGKALQIFTRNQRQWKPAPLTTKEVEAFSSEWQNCPEMESFYDTAFSAKQPSAVMGTHHDGSPNSCSNP